MAREEENEEENSSIITGNSGFVLVGWHTFRVRAA